MISKSVTKGGRMIVGKVRSETTQKLHIRGCVGVQEVGGNVEGKGTKEPALCQRGWSRVTEAYSLSHQQFCVPGE